MLKVITAFMIVVLAGCQTTQTATPTQDPNTLRVGMNVPARMFCLRDFIDLIAKGDKKSNRHAEAAAQFGLRNKKCFALRQQIPVEIMTIEYTYMDYAGDEVAIAGVLPVIRTPEVKQMYIVIYTDIRKRSGGQGQPQKPKGRQA
jgi:hypothetical protein